MTYSNGADGSCVECGAETEQEWHEFCPGCYAEQQGWSRPDREALAEQADRREVESIARLAARLGELEIRVRRLEQESVS